MKKITSTKQKLLNKLKKDGVCTIGKIMEGFTITEIAVRKHIHELEQQGFIKKNTVKQELGRPYFTYELTEKGHSTFPNQYAQLPLELLQDLEELQGKEAVNSLLSKRLEREKGEMEKLVGQDNFEEKISKVANIQNQKGYMVELEQSDDGKYIITNYNCPIANIASTYNQVCVNEKKIFEGVFPASEVISESLITKGHNFCRWVIKKPEGMH
ncbi:DeoR family transcriptional regulator [Virgibacillus sp. YIM 98842]|uniref:helix-turn-helix transcriptional regulator n=1 Tax=Virgibacillus sp. YIM 98842 TaxID=2663533 RepID=UPI0013D9E0EE|nr:DeoR family transcriptional regulator [Virgibacillus sp. YIM 98842]